MTHPYAQGGPSNFSFLPVLRGPHGQRRLNANHPDNAMSPGPTSPGKRGFKKYCADGAAVKQIHGSLVRSH